MRSPHRSPSAATLLTLLLFAAWSSSVCAAAEAAAADAKARELYEIHCSNCHGLEGDGEGSAAYLVYPKPRNFKTGLFRFRSTVSGTLPTDGDLARTVRLGVPGTAMPAFGGILSEAEIAGLVEIVKGYFDGFKTAPAAKTIVIHRRRGFRILSWPRAGRSTRPWAARPAMARRDAEMARPPQH